MISIFDIEDCPFRKQFIQIIMETKDEVQSVALIGFVRNILNVFDFIGSHDGKTLSYNILYSDNSVDTLELTFDIKGILFQNVDRISSEVMLLIDDSGMRMCTTLYETRPPVILGSRKGIQLLNH